MDALNPSSKKDISASLKVFAVMRSYASPSAYFLASMGPNKSREVVSIPASRLRNGTSMASPSALTILVLPVPGGPPKKTFCSDNRPTSRQMPASPMFSPTKHSRSCDWRSSNSRNREEPIWSWAITSKGAGLGGRETCSPLGSRSSASRSLRPKTAPSLPSQLNIMSPSPQSRMRS